MCPGSPLREVSQHPQYPTALFFVTEYSILKDMLKFFLRFVKVASLYDMGDLVVGVKRSGWSIMIMRCC